MCTQDWPVYLYGRGTAEGASIVSLGDQVGDPTSPTPTFSSTLSVCLLGQLYLAIAQGPRWLLCTCWTLCCGEWLGTKQWNLCSGVGDLANPLSLEPATHLELAGDENTHTGI